MSEFFSNRLGSRDLNRDNYYIPVDPNKTAATQGGGNPSFAMPVGRISRSSFPLLLQNTWEQLTGLSTVEKNISITLNPDSLTITDAGWYVLGAQITLTGPINDFNLEYRILGDGVPIISEKFRILKAGVAQTEVIREECYLPENVELTVEVFSSIPGYTVDYVGLYTYMKASANLGSSSSDAASVSFDDSNVDFTALTVQTAIEENEDDIRLVETRVTTLENDITSDYIEINSTGTFASATGDDAISIGENVLNAGITNTAIGKDINNTSFASNNVIVGSLLSDQQGDNNVLIGYEVDNSSNSNRSNGVIIGYQARGNTNDSFGYNNFVAIGSAAKAEQTQTVAIGFNALSSNNFAVSLGRNSIASGTSSLALGDGAIASQLDSAQIGTGSNATASTLQFLTNRLANAQGLYTSFITPTNYTPADDDNITSHLQAIDVEFGNFGQLSDYIAVNSTGSIATATGDDAIAIGEDSDASGLSSIAIGDTCSATNSSAISIGGGSQALSSVSLAIGNGARVNVTNAPGAIAIGNQANCRGDDAVQLGQGINTIDDTFQFLTNRIANAEGLYTNHVATNYSPADTDNVTSHFAAIDFELGNLQTNGNLQPQTVNRETITANKTLLLTEPIYHHIISNTAALSVDLPVSPVNGNRYLVKNSASSTESFTINSVVITPGDIYEVIYDGTEWIEI